MLEHDDEMIDALDLVLIDALVEFLVDKKGLHRESTRFLLEQNFNVTSYRNIKRCNLNRAKEFLVDLHDITVH